MKGWVILLTCFSGIDIKKLRYKLDKTKLFNIIPRYTTLPRDEKNLDEVVYLTWEQFIRKLENWDFIYNRMWIGEYKAISWIFLPNKENIILVDFEEMEEISYYLDRKNIPNVTVLATLWPELQLKQLWIKDRRSNKEVTEMMKKDDDIDRALYDVEINDKEDIVEVLLDII